MGDVYFKYTSPARHHFKIQNNIEYIHLGLELGLGFFAIYSTYT
jgi:hypothetical protein